MTWRALAIAGGAPDRRTCIAPSACSSPPVQLVAEIGKGLPRHSAKLARACAWVAGITNVTSSIGRGTTLSDTSSSAPKMPCEPASRRETSYPATFFMTSPPNDRIRPSESSSRVPSTKSRKALSLIHI